MNVKIGFRTMFGDVRARWLVIGALVLNASMWAIILWLLPRSGSLLPLHYTIYFGINLTGTWRQLLWLPSIGLLVCLLHGLIAQSQLHSTWRRLWLTLGLVLNGLFLIDVIIIVLYIRTSNF